MTVACSMLPVRAADLLQDLHDRGVVGADLVDDRGERGRQHPGEQPADRPAEDRAPGQAPDESGRRREQGPRLVRRPSRSGTKLSPRSRTDWRAMATPARTRPKTRARTRGPQVVLVRRRGCSRPSRRARATSGHELSIRCRSSLGVPIALPMPRTGRCTTRIQTAREFAPREVRMIWPAMSPMPRKATADGPAATPATVARRVAVESGREEPESDERGEDDVREDAVDHGRDHAGSCDPQASRRPARRGPAPRPCACGARRGTCS